MFVCMTTSNYPDIMIPYYEKSRSAFIFFGGFMAIGLYLLLNLLLAVFYNHYKNRLTKKTSKFENQRKQFFEQKFSKIDSQDRGYITIQEFRKHFGNRFLKRNKYVRKFLKTIEKENGGQIALEDYNLIFEFMEAD